jgi:hypothetical protein
VTYPVLTIDKAQELANLLRIESENGGDPESSFVNESDWVTERPGHSYERALVERCATESRLLLANVRASDGTLSATAGQRLEALMAEPVHSSISQLQMDMLEDEDFWRYLALFPFRWYLLAREPELQPQDFGGYDERVDEDGRRTRTKKLMKAQLIFRTYLWGKIAFDEDGRKKYARATVIADIGGPSIDIWHSHLIRTQLGQLGRLGHAFIDVVVESISDPTKMKDPAREAEKLLARIKHNVLLDIYSKDEADSITSEQLSKVL